MLRETLMSWTNVWTWFSWLAPQQLSYFCSSLGHISLTFLLSFFFQIVVQQEYPLDNTQIRLEQAALSFYGLSSSSVNAPEVLRLLSLWDLIRETSPSDRKAQGRPPPTSWPGDVPTPPGPGKVFRHIAQENLERTSIPLDNWVHAFQPGAEVWVKN